jgi:FixJ family two-component response regulator
MSATDLHAPQQTTFRPRILVVDDEPNVVGLLNDVVGREIACEIIQADSMASARKVLKTQGVELMVTDVNLPDGQGTELLDELKYYQPSARAVVITGKPTMGGAINAMRGGAVDFLPKPFNAQQLIDRVHAALKAQAEGAKKDKRIIKLRDAVKRLNVARKTVSKKVDLLCNDLITAYGELSRQLDTVRTQESFRKTLEEAKDLEQLLCHAMDWMLRQMGYSNVAIWLAGEENDFQLGAYMKYTIQGEPQLTEALRTGIVPIINKEAFVHLNSDEAREKLSAAELHFLKDCTVLGVNCTYLGEVLATIVLFRDGKVPFTEEDAEALKLISPVFATSLASNVKGEEGFDEEGDGALLDEDVDDKPRKKKNEDADWWKRGEEPPF